MTTSVPSLRFFAFCIGGPIDFVISGGINAVVAWLVFASNERVGWIGWHSVLIVSGPMLFILPLLTTYFGYLSGVTQRKQGKFGQPWQMSTPWSRQAWRHSLLRSLAIGTFGCLAIYAFGSQDLIQSIAKWTYVASNGIFAGSLAYVLHSTAILRADGL